MVEVCVRVVRGHMIFFSQVVVDGKSGPLSFSAEIASRKSLWWPNRSSGGLPRPLLFEWRR